VLETSARLLRLLALLQTRTDWTGPQLAERLKVTTRTIRNDVDRLRRLGYPVDAAPGVAGGYQLGAGTSLPPLLLDDDEAVAVAVGLRMAANGGVAGTEDARWGRSPSSSRCCLRACAAAWARCMGRPSRFPALDPR
jgi:predicted DNA-binding transcriptional regulator YafY